MAENGGLSVWKPGSSDGWHGQKREEGCERAGLGGCGFPECFRRRARFRGHTPVPSAPLAPSEADSKRQNSSNNTFFIRHWAWMRSPAYAGLGMSKRLV